MDVPKQFLRDFVLTLAYLIIRMPSRVLEFVAPIDVLSKALPTYKIFNRLPPKVFVL